MTLKNNNIEELKSLKKSIEEISVYDLNVYSSIELYCNIANKVNEVIRELKRHEIFVSEEILEQNNVLQEMLDSGLHNEVINKINDMVNDGTMDLIINQNVLEELNLQIKEKANEADLEIERKRIDSFSSLTEGSTTGDAELIDGRVGADGITYPNIGTSIRNQFAKIDKITEVFPLEFLTPKIKTNIELVLGSCNQNGNISYGGIVRRVTDYLDLYKYGTFYFGDEYVNTRAYWLRLFNANKDFIGSYNSGNISNKKVNSKEILELFPDAKYCVFSIKCTDPMDGNLETRNTEFFSDRYAIDSIPLDNHYKRAEFYGVITEDIQLEIGGMDRYTGTIVKGGYGTNLRTPFFIKVIPRTKLDFSYYDRKVDIIEYDRNFEFIKYTETYGSIYLDKNTKYIKIHRYNANGVNVNEKIKVTLHSDTGKIEYAKNIKTNDDHESFAYKLNGENYYTNGKLKLPSNYSNVGKPVPLIVFSHGSADFYGLDSSKMTTHYEKYYNYLRDCGYAIFDCYGWGNKYSDLITGTNTWATPTNLNCYLSGIKYVLDKFNIDRENIFVAGKSLGGIQAFALCYQNQIKINACGLLAPALNPLHQTFGYTKAERMTLAQDFGFSEDVNNVLNTDNFVENDNYISYIKDNATKMCGWNPYWINMILDNNTKVMNSIKLLDGKNADYSSIFKTCNVPFKVWVANDDININPYAIKNVVKAMNNAGCLAEVRIMPNGTGGHHSVDNDVNAPQTTNVITKLGVHYDSIPTAYYELVKHFDKYLI